MKVRQQLRLWAAISLALQSVWLFAIVPADCCAAHSSPETSCHETVTATHCPMPGDNEAACPMHRGDQQRPATDDCRMRGSCAGPMSALLTLLSAQAVLTAEAHAFVSPSSAPSLPDRTEQLTSQLTPPESPPPRA